MAKPEQYETFVQLFARHVPGLRAFVRTMLPGWDDVEEVIQETSLVLWRKFPEFESGTNFSAWAFGIARYEVLKYRRNMARDRLVLDEDLLDMLADESIQRSDRAEQERRSLALCIEALEPQQRDLVRACYSGKSIKSVAGELERSPTSVYKSLNRVRGLLLKCIENHIAEEDLP